MWLHIISMVYCCTICSTLHGGHHLALSAPLRLGSLSDRLQLLAMQYRGGAYRIQCVRPVTTSRTASSCCESSVALLAPAACMPAPLAFCEEKFFCVCSRLLSTGALLLLSCSGAWWLTPCCSCCAADAVISATLTLRSNKENVAVNVSQMQLTLCSIIYVYSCIARCPVRLFLLQCLSQCPSSNQWAQGCPALSMVRAPECSCRAFRQATS